MFRKFLLFTFVVLFVGGCAATTPPTPEEQQAAYYGKVISQEEAEQIVKTYVESRLKDSSSAQYAGFTQVEKGYLKSGLIYGGNVYYGYRINVNVNAKNSYGGYVGFQPYVFVLRDGRVITAWTTKTDYRGYTMTVPF